MNMEENNKIYKIYKYTSPSNKVYIGQTCKTLEQRACYSGIGYRHSSYFYNAIKKYGYNNFKKEILIDNLSLEEANFWEQYYINYYHSNDKNYGYNISLGGNNHIMSEEKKKKASDRMKKNNPMFSTETVAKVKEKLRSRKLNKEICENMSKTHKKRILCLETGEIFNSREEAANFYNVSPSGIGRAANGQQKTSAEKHWRYINED